MRTPLTRRRFLGHTAVGGATALALVNSRLAFTYAANEALNVAGIGVGGQGRGNLDTLAGLGQNLVALCDVDLKQAGDIFQKHPRAKPYRDFRRMFDAMERGIDAVVVSTPDHTHAVAVGAALRRGKHVYCEKPLTRTVREARRLRELAAQQRVVTQMGNQGSADGRLRRAVELAWGGVLGEIREAHVWFDGGNGPLARPSDTPPVPTTLEWDLWLGPAPERPYHPGYLPGSWRGWRAFGSGIVGDFGCHTGNIMMRSLRLHELWSAPASGTSASVVVRAEAKPSEVNAEGYPSAMHAVLRFPPRGSLPPVTVTLHAKERPPEALMLGYPQAGWGDLLVGSKGSLYSDCPWNSRYVLLPEKDFDGFRGGPPESLPRSGGHHREWVDACQGRGTTFSGFDIGGPLTEIMQLANLATLVEGPLEYDTLSGRILNSPGADALLHREYPKGWEI